MEHTEKLPGVTFHVESSELRRKVGKVVLSAEVQDDDLWSEVIRRLHGSRVYTVDDLPTAIVEVIQENANIERDKLLQQIAVLREELERTKQQLDFAINKVPKAAL